MSRPLPHSPPAATSAPPPEDSSDEADLPDPLQEAAPPARESSEDVLSELAGQEVDRLYCESKVDSDLRPRPERRKAKPAVDDPVQAIPAENPTEDAAGDLDRLFAEERPVADAPAEPATSDSGPEPDPPGSPLALQSLIWLNAPVNQLPSPLQDALGKIALVTILNAVAVIVYVLFVR